QVELFQAAGGFALAQVGGEVGELLSQPLDAAVKRDPWLLESGARRIHGTSYDDSGDGRSYPCRISKGKRRQEELLSKEKDRLPVAVGGQPGLFTRVRDETAETLRETNDEPARLVAARLVAAEWRRLQ
ncbi:MAG: hypothetical protein KGO23_07485, partial [Nitrospirota bacterium]|nr:hypothetical protein [Nitrospirota bacterium]